MNDFKTYFEHMVKTATSGLVVVHYAWGVTRMTLQCLHCTQEGGSLDDTDKRDENAGDVHSH